MTNFINFIKGIVIGVAVVVPGFSASTFSVVMGIYEKMIHALNNFRSEFKESLLFLLPIAIGALAGILGSANLVLFLLDEFPLPSYAFFIGLVLGSVPVIYGKMKPGLKRGGNYFFFWFGILAILAMTFFAPYSDEATAITSINNFGHVAIIFFAGVAACILMALPGMSGSIVLMLMGMFGTVYGAVANFNEMVMMIVRGEGGVMSLGISSAIILLVYLGGAVTGIFLAARIMGHLIKKHEATVYFMVLGLVLGAVVTLIHMGVIDSFIYAENVSENFINLMLLVGFTIIGFIVTRIIGKERT